MSNSIFMQDLLRIAPADPKTNNTQITEKDRNKENATPLSAPSKKNFRSGHKKTPMADSSDSQYFCIEGSIKRKTKRIDYEGLKDIAKAIDFGAITEEPENEISGKKINSKRTEARFAR